MSITNEEQRQFTLLKVLLDPNMQTTTKSVVNEIISSPSWEKDDTKKDSKICNNQKHELAMKLLENMKDLIHKVKSKQGRWSNVSEQFVRTLFTGLFTEGALKGFSTQVIQDAFGLTRKSITKRLKKCIPNIRSLQDNNLNACKIEVKGFMPQKISQHIRQQIVNFVNNHEHVRFSPNVNDVLTINNQKIPKKLLEISKAELHQDLSKSGIEGILDKNNNIIISESMFHVLLKEEMPYLKKATKNTCNFVGVLHALL